MATRVVLLFLLSACSHTPCLKVPPPRVQLARTVYSGALGCPNSMVCMSKADANRLGPYIMRLQRYANQAYERCGK